MDPKKAVIVQEIKYWQKNHLLPAHYCQFLLNLYLEGEGEDELTKQIQTKRLSWKMGFLSFLISLTLLGVFWLVMKFDSFSLTLQGTILGTFSLMLYLGTALLSYRKSIAYHLALGVASLSTLFTILWLGIGLEVRANVLFIMLIATLIIWLASGLLFRVNYIVLITIIGFMLSYGWYIHPWSIAQQSMILLHLAWVPFAIVGIAVGVQLLKKGHSLGRLIFFSGLIALFAPSFHSFFIEGLSVLFEIIFILIELIITTILLYYYRNHWQK